MIAFIDQEASEKVEEIDAKVVSQKMFLLIISFILQHIVLYCGHQHVNICGNGDNIPPKMVLVKLAIFLRIDFQSWAILELLLGFVNDCVTNKDNCSFSYTLVHLEMYAVIYISPQVQSS